MVAAAFLVSDKWCKAFFYSEDKRNKVEKATRTMVIMKPPHIAANINISLPTGVKGTMSPNPTVLIVTTTTHIDDIY